MNKSKPKEITQEMMKNARTKGIYGDIWTTRDKCVFCDLKDKYILHEENGIVLTISLYPYIDGHLMAIPREHVTSPKQLSPVQWETLRKFNYIAKKAIRKVHGHKSMWSVLREGGINAQMTVSDHLHMHYIPFDKSDLCEWNYRELEYTPLQNVDKYKQVVKELQKANAKFEKKYTHGGGLQLVVDLLLVNDKNEVLVAERNKQSKFVKDYWNMPGGHVDDFDKGIIPELQREMQEELSYEFDLSKAELVESQISSLTYRNPSKYLKSDMPYQHRFLWNVYLLSGFRDAEKLKPGDDTKKLIWLDINQAADHEKLSPGARGVIKKVIKILNQE